MSKKQLGLGLAIVGVATAVHPATTKAGKQVGIALALLSLVVSL